MRASTGETGNFEYDADTYNLYPGDTGGTGALHMTRLHVFVAFLLEMGMEQETRLLALLLADRLDLVHQAGFILVASFQWPLPADLSERYRTLASELFRRARRVFQI